MPTEPPRSGVRPCAESKAWVRRYPVMLAFLQVQSAFTKRVSAMRPVQVWYDPVVVVPGMVTMGPLPEQMSEAVPELPPPGEPPLPFEPPFPLWLPAVPPVPPDMPWSSTPQAAVSSAAATAAEIQSSPCFMMRRPFSALGAHGLSAGPAWFF